MSCCMVHVDDGCIKDLIFPPHLSPSSPRNRRDGFYPQHDRLPNVWMDAATTEGKRQPRWSRMIAIGYMIFGYLPTYTPNPARGLFS